MKATRTLTCDVCILGAGAAGLYLAHLLSRDSSRSVALIEAGPRRFTQRHEPYVVNSLKRSHRGVNEARVTAFGGATNIWGGGLIRPRAEDLSPLAGQPDSGWPIEYATLAPHLDAAEEDFGAMQIGSHMRSPSYDAGTERFTRRYMKVLPFSRQNFARHLGNALAHRPGVTAVLEASLPRLIDVQDGRVRTIEVESAGNGVRVDARHFVIAAGVVNSIVLAQRFLDVNVGVENPNLGRHLHDHFSIPLYAVQPEAPFAFSKRFSYHFEKSFMLAERYEVVARVGKRGSAPGAFFHLTFDFGRSPVLRAIKAMLRPGRHLAARPSLSVADFFRSMGAASKIAVARVANGCLYIPPDVEVIGVLDIEQQPRVEWSLTPVRDGLGCDITWDIHALDIEHARRYVLATRELVRSLMAEAGFNAVELFPDPTNNAAEFEEFVRAKAWDTYHLAGGLRMGTLQTHSVVSPVLAFHGIPNLYALSTAVFPRTGASNPTLALLALTHRLAGHLRRSVEH